MRSFLKLTAISIQSRMYYRVSLFLNLLTPVVLLIGQYLLWNALYAQQAGHSIGGMAQKEMLSYILIAFAMSNLLTWSSENTLAREIRSGTVAARIIRPTPFIVQSVSEMTGSILLQGLINFIIVILGYSLFSGYLLRPTPGEILIFFPCLLLAVLLRMMLIDVFSLFCFFSTGYLGITWTRNALFDFFSGSLIPVAIFPQWLKTVSYMTPFPYMLQVPAAVLLGQKLPGSIPMMFLWQLLWLCILFLLHAVIYRRVRRNMSIAGG